MALDRTKLTKLGEELTKAASKPSTPSAALLKLLDEVAAGVPTATDEVLRTTRIGVLVNRVKSLSKDTDVQKRAADLITKWKREIAAAKDSKPPGGSSTPSRATASKESTPKPSTPKPSASAAVAPPPTNGKKEEFTLPKDLDKRTSATDGVSLKQSGDPARDGCAKLMYDGLAFRSTEPPSTILPLALAIESAAFGLLCDTGRTATAEYKSKMRSLFQNLKNRESGHLRKGVLAGKLRPDRLVRMTPDEMKSEKQRAEDEKFEKENMDKAMVAQEEKSISTALQCGKCKAKKTSYTQAQTRSADEPMTTFCECLVCGNRWKFS